MIFLLISIVVSSANNFFSALGPEIGFDALWYHLTIPKLYLEFGKVFHIPGGLLYYSEMPRWTEMIYLTLLQAMSDTGPHLVNWLSGLGIIICLYLISRQFLNRIYSLLSVAMFYASPIVSWLSSSAYIELPRTFWELISFLFILKRKYFLTALSMGIALSIKFHSIGSLAILTLIAYMLFKNPLKSFLMALLAILVAVPWFIMADLNTGYPLYPLGAGIIDSQLSSSPSFFQPLSFLGNFWKVFLAPDDLISPIYVTILPFLMISIKKVWQKFHPLVIFFLLSSLLWGITPPTGGGRFLIPYLPLWSVLVSGVIFVQTKWNKYLLIFASIVIISFNIFYRLAASYRLRNFLLGNESKQANICQRLDFSLGTFVDCDGFFEKNLSSKDLVYVSGVHNLFYLNFPFVHETWYHGQPFNYILLQNQKLSLESLDNESLAGDRIKNNRWELIYTNNKTRVKLYKIVQP